ncbi:DUF3558 family protein [Nocardia otitidiscaviarum]|uniref:DUF3558 family protein n=1 Tax=Nocardia otitidiscaviarum TaxID=1823 RepID=UPI001894F0AA|nr:DUF3558 family protein [Nocardia otitidiscaviarum]MBF6178263.1 DUF3558 family protein [Nocardia otitidiscaviarum]
MRRTREFHPAPCLRGGGTRTAALRIAAVLGGAALALAGCTTDSTGSAPAPGEATAVTTTTGALTTNPGIGATTPPGDGGTKAPEPTRADSPAPDPAPVDSPVSEPTRADTAAPTTESASGAFWDPCSLPESDLVAVGLDPATEVRMTESLFAACEWLSTDRTFELILTHSGDSMDYVLTPGNYKDLRRSEYYGREFAVFRAASDSDNIGCLLVTPAESGSFVFTLRNSQPYGEDACLAIQRVGGGLLNSLP